MQMEDYQHHPELVDALNKSEQWMVQSQRLAGTGGLDTDGSNMVGRVLWHLSIEHYQSIHLLTENGLFGSAYALLRPQFESYVRGTWLHYCANPKRQKAFIRGVRPPSISDMLIDIERLDQFQEGELSQFSSAVLNQLHDLTHGGARQFWNRVSANGIESNFGHNELCQLIRISGHMSFMAFIALADTANNSNLMNKLNDSYLATMKPNEGAC